ncbi:hypothetical protein [Brumimicrobium sp.]|uniref:hypothetical protein n=1 Tax=Brumimicrobium sp. TaxID=2029867 RepID=UPI003A942CCB
MRIIKITILLLVVQWFYSWTSLFAQNTYRLKAVHGEVSDEAGAYVPLIRYAIYGLMEKVQAQQITMNIDFYFLGHIMII